MRWQALFDDLEGQLEQAERAEFEAEVRDRTRRERALVRAVDRLRTATGQRLVVGVTGAAPVDGELLDCGPDWLLLAVPGGEALVAWQAVTTVTGLGAVTAAPGAEGEVERRLDLRWALRGLSRSRAAVRAALRDGTTLSGTVDRVAADHVDLAEHPLDEPRRAGVVRAVHLVPLGALALVRSS